MASAQLGVEELIHGDRAISKVGLRQIRALLKLSKIGLGLWYESDSDLVAGLPDLLAGLVDLRGRDIVTVGSLIVTWFSGGPPYTQSASAHPTCEAADRIERVPIAR